jgi:hypothetical protein
MKQQLNEVQKLQKIAGILKESIFEAPNSKKDVYLAMRKDVERLRKRGSADKWFTALRKLTSYRDKLSTQELIELIKDSGVSLNGIKKGLIKTFRSEPFSEPDDVNSAIEGVKAANSLEQMAKEIEDYSSGYFNEKTFYDLVQDLIEQGTIK